MVNEDALKCVIGSVLDVDPSTIGPESSSDTITGWDSLKHMNLVIALEEEFGVSIPDDEAANITSYALIRVVLEELILVH